MTDSLARLRAWRRLDTDVAVRDFERALADLPETLDSETLDELHLLLYDDTVVPEVMYGLVHRLERTPVGDQEASVLRVLPRMAATAPWWIETVVMRLINNDESRAALLESAEHAPEDHRAALRSVLERISEEPDAVGRVARSTIVVLDARPNGSS